MAYHLYEHPIWDSGPGSQIKYGFELDVDVDVVSVSGHTATISMVGSVTVENYANNTSNVQKASDYAVVTTGPADVWDYQFTPYVDYYEDSLPCAPGAPQSVIDGILLEFRGDTWRSDPYMPGNRSSLYMKGQGLVLDQLYSTTTRTFSINMTFTIDVTEGDVPILAYVGSGWTSGPIYEWLDHDVLVSYFQLEYVPGMINNGNGGWLSHNRSGGTLKLYNGSNWGDNLRTADGGTGTGNPPSIYNGSAWANQKRIGLE